ncbi:hypothetical protein [Corallococcus sp. 4LFB]|uniref:hypothetical protein n=1 Tax=Corallococcus sp. 4LFB TaxID=3383249 RepID=UPI0039760BF7
MPFWPSDQERIDRAAESLARGHLPPELPPRHVVSASREALERRLAPPERISRTVLNHLVRLGSRSARTPGVGVTQAA